MWYKTCSASDYSSTAKELAPSNAKVCVICPGVVATNLLSTNPNAVQESVGGFLTGMELGISESEDIANACYFTGMYNQHTRCCAREMRVCHVNQVNTRSNDH